MVHYGLRYIITRSDAFKRNNLTELNFLETDLTPRNDVTSDCPLYSMQKRVLMRLFMCFLSRSEVTYCVDVSALMGSS